MYKSCRWEHRPRYRWGKRVPGGRLNHSRGGGSRGCEKAIFVVDKDSLQMLRRRETYIFEEITYLFVPKEGHDACVEQYGMRLWWYNTKYNPVKVSDIPCGPSTMVTWKWSLTSAVSSLALLWMLITVLESREWKLPFCEIAKWALVNENYIYVYIPLIKA